MSIDKVVWYDVRCDMCEFLLSDMTEQSCPSVVEAEAEALEEGWVKDPTSDVDAPRHFCNSECMNEYRQLQEEAAWKQRVAARDPEIADWIKRQEARS